MKRVAVVTVAVALALSGYSRGFPGLRSWRPTRLSSEPLGL